MAVRRLNVRFVIILVVITLLLMCASYAAYRINKARLVSRLYNDGTAAYEAGDMPKAVDNFRKFAAITKDMDKRREVIRKMADIFAQEIETKGIGSPAEMKVRQSVIEEARRSDPNDKKLAEALAKCYAASPTEGVKGAQLYQELANKYPDQPEYLLYSARCCLNADDRTGANDKLVDLMARHPAYLEGYVKYAEYCTDTLQQLESAIDTYNVMVDSNERSASAFALRAIFYMEHKEIPNYLENAQEDVAYAMRLDSKNVDALTSAAMLAICHKNYEKAREYLEQADALVNTRPPRITNLFVQLADLEGKPEDAIGVLQRTIEADPANMQQRVRLFQRLIALGRLEDAKKEVANLKKNSTMPLDVLGFFDASIEILEEKWASAVKKLELARPFLEMNPEILAYIDRQRALCYGKLGQVDRQIEAFQKAIVNASDTETVPFYIAYIRTLNQAGRTDLLDQAFAELIGKIGGEKLRQIPELRAIYVATLMQKESLLPEEEQDWSRVTQAIQDFEIDTYNNAEGILLSVRLSIKQGKIQDARTQLQRAITTYPDSLLFVSCLALLEAQEKNFDTALRLIDEAKEKFPNAFGIYMTKIRVVIQQDEVVAKAALREIEKEIANFAVEKRVAIQKQLVQGWIYLDDTEQAAALLDLIAEAEPENLGIKVQLFDLARKANNEAEMKAQMAAIRVASSASSAEYLYCQAAEMIWRFNQKQINSLQLRQAVNILERAQGQRPNWVNIPRALAEIALLEKDDAAAIRHLYSVDKISGLSLRQLDLLIKLLYKEKRDAEVAQLLAQKRGNQLAADAAMMSVEALVNTGEGDEALRRAREIADPDKLKDLIWKGQIAFQAKNYREAEITFRQVTEKFPKDPSGWLRLLHVLRVQGEEVSAEDFILNIRSNVPLEEQPLCLAKAYQLLGRAVEAEATFKEALALKPDDIETLFAVSQFYMTTTRPDFAIPHLQKMMDLILVDPKLSADMRTQHLAWARRALAQVLGGLQDYDAQERAIVLLDENLRQQPDSLEDLRVKALILASRNNPLDNQNAINLLENIPAPSARERFALAKLYYAQSSSFDGESLWDKCAAIMTNLITKNENNVEYLKSFVVMMMFKKESADAILPYVDRLEALLPNDLQTCLFRAQLIALSGNMEQAETYLLQHLPTTITQENAPMLVRCAHELEQMGRLEACERLWNRLSSFNSDYAFQMCCFLARQEKRLGDALDILETAALEKTPVQMFDAITATLRSAPERLKEAEIARARDLGKKIAGDNTNSLEYILFTAQIHEAAGDYEEAERVYLAALKTPASAAEEAGIMNSYAYLLAMQGKDLGKAIQMIDKALRALPGRAYVLDSRAVVYMKTGERARLDQAQEDLMRTIVKSNDALGHFHLATVFFLKENRNAAKIAFENAKRLDPFLYISLPQMEVKDYNALSVGLK
ncbi:MAG: tetratricopeptide repeat protein [Planctomycetia bacterium]|nr:tetratricopeptide repeat protein [Planctomycetia bacterium]